MSDTGAGIALGTAAVPYLGLAALLLPSGPGGHELVGSRVLAAGSAAAGAAVLALAAVGGGAPVFLGLLLVALLAALAGGLLIGGLTAEQLASVLSVVAVLAGAFVPGLAFRLSGLRLPALPRNAEELQEGIEPFPAERVLARSLVADDYLMALYTAVGAVCAGCLVLLAFAGTGWAAPAQAGALAVLLLLHGRVIGSVRQRLALLLPGSARPGCWWRDWPWGSRPGRGCWCWAGCWWPGWRCWWWPGRCRGGGCCRTGGGRPMCCTP